MPQRVLIVDDERKLVHGLVAYFRQAGFETLTAYDGRAFSQARLLRERHGFKGEIRATGAVLRDQLLFMQRCGFDAFEIVNQDAVAAWRAALAEIQVFFQPTGDGPVEQRARVLLAQPPQ